MFQPEAGEKADRLLEREDAVQQAIYVTGAADVFLIIAARDVEAYDQITQRLVMENPNVRRVTTSVALQTFKRGLLVPIDDGAQ